MFGYSPNTRAAILSLFGAMLVLPSAAAAADLHVTTTAGGDCSTVLQGCTLSSALAAAQTGDRILVHAGIYPIASAVQDTAGVSGVTIVGAPGEARPVLDASGGSLTLTHGTSISTLDLSTTSGTALFLSGGLADRLRVTIGGTSSTGVDLGSGGLLRNSDVFASGASDTGVKVGGSISRGTIIGTSIVASGAGAAAGAVAPESPATQSTMRAVNTIFSGVNGAVDLRVNTIAGQSASAVLHHCATDLSRQLITGAGSSIDQADATLTADPIFVDRANGDLREATTSPTIDAGTADVDSDGNVDATDAILGGTFDLFGKLRVQGTPDIGSDERVGAAVASPTPAAAPTPTPAQSTTPFVPAPVPIPVHLPGFLPSLRSFKSHQLNGLYPFRLRCNHSVSCRGLVLLTRIGVPRSETFKIPPGAERTVRLQLSSAERALIRLRPNNGVRGLLEVRSLDQGSDWAAVRLYPRLRPGSKRKTKTGTLTSR